MISPDLDERWLAYTTTIVRIDHPSLGTFVVGPESVVQPTFERPISGSYPVPGGGPVHIMTAHNPGRALDADENDRRQWLLRSELDQQPGLDVWTALGGDPQWVHTEDSVAIVGLDDAAALRLAGSHGQDAIFSWRETEWWLLSCVDNRTWSAKWSIRLSDR